MKILSVHVPILAALGLILMTGSMAHAEPEFCSPDRFVELERGNNIPYLDRVHVFQVGRLTLAGLGVGDSDERYVASLAQQYGSYRAEEKSCVFYFNDGNEAAAAAFNHVYLPSPVLRGKSIAEKYDQLATPLIDQTPTSFLSCAREHKFIAMGCDGMRHRGPSVFAMLLGYAGCSPESASEIANRVWGTNHVLRTTRKEIALKGYEAGNRNPKGRAELQRLMRGSN